MLQKQAMANGNAWLHQKRGYTNVINSIFYFHIVCENADSIQSKLNTL